MSMVDVFQSDAFNCVSLTRALSHLPFQPRRLGAMGLFVATPIDTRVAVIEEERGVLGLVPTIVPGSEAQPFPSGTSAQAPPIKRKLRSFPIRQLVKDDKILLADLASKRAFGSDNTLEAVATEINKKMLMMRKSIELTQEWFRVGAVKGIIVDSDAAGTEYYNLFTKFEITPNANQFFDLDNVNSNIDQKILDVEELVEQGMGDAEFDHVHAICGTEFWSKFTTHPKVYDAFRFWQQSRVLVSDMRAGFPWRNTILEKYRGQVGGTKFVADGDAHFFPAGSSDTFIEAFAPADYLDAVRSPGLPVYAVQWVPDPQRAVHMQVQSNPLPLCTRPGALVTGKAAAS